MKELGDQREKIVRQVNMVNIFIFIGFRIRILRKGLNKLNLRLML